MIGFGGVDPDGVVVGVLVFARLSRVERFAAVAGDMKEHVDLVHLVGVDRRGKQFLVVVRAGAARHVAVAAFPGAAPVGGTVKTLVFGVGGVVLGGFDGGVDEGGVGGGDGEADLAQVARRETLAELGPGGAAVGGGVDARAGAAAHEGPHVAATLIGGGVDRVGIVGGENGAGDTGVIVRFQADLPAGTTVSGREQAAFAARRPQRTLRRDMNGAAVTGVDEDVGDVFGGVQAHVVPRRAAIEAAIHAGAPGHMAAADRLAGADPHRFGTVGVDGDAADRIRLLMLEDRRPCRACVGGLPHAARTDRHVPGRRSVWVHGHIGDAAAHQGRADAAEAEPAKGPGDGGGFAAHMRARLGDGCDATLNSDAEISQGF